jgi:acyl-CoA synthetase (NDP forming)
VTRLKPIVLMKVGRTPEGASAALSHTGSLSGSDQVNKAALKQAGIIRVGRVDEMLDAASALIRQPLPKGRRVGIVTGGGGFGVVAADACRDLGLEVPPLKAETIERLGRYMPERWSHANPVDMAGDSSKSLGCCGTMLKAEEVDAVLAVSCLGYIPTPPEDCPPAIREKIAAYDRQMLEGEKAAMAGLLERIDRSGKPFIIAAVANVRQSQAMAELARNGIYTYASPEDGARVLAYLADYSDYLASRSARDD